MLDVRDVVVPPYPASTLYRDPGSTGSRKQKEDQNNATQACSSCRKSKIKCPGEVPRCSNCVAKGRQCGYEGGDPGISRQEAAKSRLEALEKLLSTLQTKSPDENEHLLQRIRTGEDLTAIIDEAAVGSAGAEAELAMRRGSDNASTAASHPETLEPASPSGLSGPATAKGKAPLRTSATNHQSVGAVIQLAVPNPEFVKYAIAAFFSSTGKLFQFFTREQVARYYDMVFDQEARETNKVAICCVALVAAMGLQYEQSDENASRERMDELYNIGRHYYEAALVEHPLDAIKVCGLLAMFNIFDKVKISLAYIEVGLSIAKKHGLDKKWHDPSIPDDVWIDNRKAWRTLMFLSSWLSFTVGYMSGVNTGMMEKMALSDFNVDHSTNIADLVQAELTKISILKADILRLSLLFKDLSFLTIETILADLREWHAQLPGMMHLHNLPHEDLPWNLRLTIYHVHLLYQGAFMLLYRRIASQMVKNRGVPGDRTLPSRPSKELVGCAEEGVLSAKSSARILGMLMAENGVFKKCWLVIYQAYTACTVVMYAVAQKQLHFLPPADINDDLECVRMCLNTLEYCASVDPVAAKFHARLSSIYQRLSENTPHVDSMFQSPGLGALAGPSQDLPPEYLLQVPEDGNPELTALALDLLIMLCTPFGGIENKKHVDESITTEWKTDPTRYEHPQLIERLEWNVENSVPFQWDMSQLGSGGSSVDLSEHLMAPLPSRFLSSSHPNGWTVYIDSLDNQA